MNFDSNIESLVEQYLKGQLSSTDTKAFEEKMAKDGSLQDYVTKERAIQTLVIQNRLLSVQSLLHTEHIKQGGNGNSGKSYWWILGSVAAITLFGTLYLLTNRTEKTEAILTNTPVTSQHYPTTDEKKSTSQSIVTLENKEKSPITKPQELVKPSKKALDTTNEVSAASNQTSSQTTHIATVTNEVQKNSEAAKQLEATTKVTTDPCLSTKINASIETIHGCSGNNESAIHVNNVSGGEAPYLEKITTSKGQETSFSGLTSGNYTIWISDNKGCIESFPVALTEKNCFETLAINPEFGEFWEIPTTIDGQVTILSKSGKKVFESKFKKGEKITWNGKDDNNRTMEGYHLFSIIYSDNRQQKGSITVTK